MASMNLGSQAAEIGLCVLLSAVDGEISDQELAALTTRVGELLGDDFDPMRLPALLDGELESIGALGVDDYVARLATRIAPERRWEALRAACVVACADGLAPEEDEILRQVAGVLELDPEAIIQAAYGKNDTIPARASFADDANDEA